MATEKKASKVEFKLKKAPVKSPNVPKPPPTPYAYVEELVVTSPSERNWRGIFIALLVIVGVLGLIVFSIILVTPPEEGPRTKGLKPSLEDIYLKLPEPAKFNGTWISDHEFAYKNRDGDIAIYNAENTSSIIILTNPTLRQYDAVDFKISSDLNYVLLISDVKKVFKYTTLARYHIYEISTSRHPLFRLTRPLSPKELDDQAPPIQYAVWSPDGTGLAFVHNNDIYYKPKIEKDLVCRITNSGKQGIIFNGVPDWLYENEILKTSHTLWFSPDGLYLLYVSFNDTLVGEYKYPWYDTGGSRSTYPTVKSFRYPKVETPNPEATVWIVNLTIPKYLFPFELKPTKNVEKGSYVTSVSFFGENNVGIVWMNRQQNTSVMATCLITNNYNCTEFYIKRDHIRWSEPIFDPIFSYTGQHALVRLPVKDGDNGHFMHACQVQKGNYVPLTHGAFELSKILAWDEEKHLVYALATNENAPGVRHLFKIGDTNSSQPWTCLTCQPRIDHNMTFGVYPDYYNETVLNNSMLAHYNCEFNNIIFSKGHKYYVQECLGPDVPVIFLVETATNTRLAVLDASNRLRRRVRRLSTPQIKTIQVEIEYGYKAQVRLFFPGVLREYEDVQFPVILLVDGAPSSQTVSSRWEVSWPWYLTSTRSYIVAQIDARGSGFQGIRMRSEIQNRFGTVEVQDQLAVLTYLRDTFKFIDRNKICVVGMGYGGYVAAMMLLQDYQQVVNCSVSISPMTSWKFHNSFFTERYMGQPSKYQQEYDNADLTVKASSLSGRNFLLIHGTADTQVSPQHSMCFAKALIQHLVLFQHLAYPDEDHHFSKKTLIHMYREIELFFNDSFGPGLDEWSDETSFFIQ